MKQAGIEYVAAMDAAHTNLPSQSIDCHFSATVLEHIQPAVLADIFIETKREYSNHLGGTAMHFVDLSDHFQHHDKSITQVNFLKFSDSEWNQIAGNEFAYCNRLRGSDYLKQFQRLGFAVNKIEPSTDQQSLLSMQSGFSIDPQFHAYANDVWSHALLHFEEY